MLLILIAGGCLCIPSEGDRVNDLAGSMCRHRVSFAILTTSVAGTLSPSSVPSLRRLVLGGEAVKPAHIATWAGKVHLMTGDGASEIAGTTIVGSNLQQDNDPRNVGFACGAGLWVVDADHPDRLAPVGAVGELISQSHGLACGYFNGNTLGILNRTSRPLVQRSIVQSSSYSNRINRLRDHFWLPSSVLRKAPRWGATSDSPLAILETLSSQFYLDIEEIMHELQRSLPSYMIPSIFVPLLSIPLTLTGNVNRRLLLETVATWPEDRFATYRCRSQASSMDKAPVTERDDQIRRLVANTLKKEVEGISMGSSFLALGGDSISAMRLVALAKQEGLCLTAGDIFNYPILSDLATVVRKGTREQSQPKQYSFEELNAYGGLLRRLSTEIANNIHEIIPATAYQRMTLTELCPRYLRIALPSNTDTLSYAPFSDHVEAVWASRNEEGLEAWRTMLRGSEMTILKPKQMVTKNVEKAIHDARAVKVIKRIPVVSPPEILTMASLVKAAWALTFAKFVSARDTTISFAETSLKDIVFSQVIHGRGLSVAHESHILGPCVNTVPQHLGTMPFENIGLDDIIRNSTDWTPGTKFGSVLRFRNFGANPSCVFDGVTYDAFVYHLPNRPSEKIHVTIMPSADGMQVIMNGYDHVVGQNEAKDLVDCFCTAIQDLARTPTESYHYKTCFLGLFLRAMANRRWCLKCISPWRQCMDINFGYSPMATVVGFRLQLDVFIY
ncbi:putative nonribosomal peptide synthase [Aspergillus bombycis]|uniref:Putative nonribosomal peptide synthase n=1 Tax=Aspergillus bombycis TaxID=109264 RepID=A0A1F7ZNQ6_9EURO|nr:putative nonribosomal peptide synthase [Aspergillus bombycis]OGM41074.1 putative nonribosomal peptide synthase [Aspergillus bombycis]